MCSFGSFVIHFRLLKGIIKADCTPLGPISGKRFRSQKLLISRILNFTDAVAVAVVGGPAAVLSSRRPGTPATGMATAATKIQSSKIKGIFMKNRYYL